MVMRTLLWICTRAAGGQHGQVDVQLGVSVLVRRLELQLQRGQGASMADLADAAALWRLRNRHAVHRPRGWRSDSSKRVPWRCLCTTHPLCASGWRWPRRLAVVSVACCCTSVHIFRRCCCACHPRASLVGIKLQGASVWDGCTVWAGLTRLFGKRQQG